MPPDADESLLSAILDGELTAEERGRVERLLAENPAWRQLRDELRAVRAAFESLPRYAPSADLGGRVLRAVEAEQRAKAARSAETGATDRDAIRLRWPRHWRALAWPVLAVAAALLMMFSPQADRQRKLAQAPKPPRLPADSQIGAAPAAPRSPVPNDRAPRSAKADAWRQLTEEDAAPRPAESAVAGERSKLAKRAAGPSARPAEMEEGEELPAAMPAREAERLDDKPQAAAPARVAAKGRQAVGELGASETAGNASGAIAAKKRAAVEPRRDDRDFGLRNAPADEMSRRKAANSMGEAGAQSPASERLGRAFEGAPVGAAKAASAPLIVEVVVTDAAAGERALKQLLARNGITTSASADKDRAPASGPGAERTAREQAKVEDDTKNLPLGDIAGDGAAPVETTLAHIEAALAELRGRPDEFISVTVRPAPDSEAQQPLAAYSRQAGAPTQLRLHAEKPESAQEKAASAPAQDALPASSSGQAAPPIRAVFILRTAESAPALQAPPAE